MDPLIKLWLVGIGSIAGAGLLTGNYVTYNSAVRGIIRAHREGGDLAVEQYMAEEIDNDSAVNKILFPGPRLVAKKYRSGKLNDLLIDYNIID